MDQPLETSSLTKPGRPTLPVREPPREAALAGAETITLPPANTRRWVIRRKAEVVAGVRNGIISLEEACHRYKISIDEFLSWQRLIESHGLAGLRTTRLKQYRGARKLELIK